MPAIQPVPYQTLVRIFERDGFTFARQSGDHVIYTKPDIRRPLVIPTYRAVPIFIIRNLLRTSGMSGERYFEPLGPCSHLDVRCRLRGGNRYALRRPCRRSGVQDGPHRPEADRHARRGSR